MENSKQARARSLPPASIASETNPSITPTVPRTSSLPPAQPAQESSKPSKKRRISESEPPEAKPQHQAKKPRTQEQSSAKKPDPQSQEPASRSPATDETKPIVPQKKGLKQEAVPSKGSKPEQASSTKGKLSKSSAPPASGISKSWPSNVGKQKIKGLFNPAQWCYRRSVLQSLIAVPQLFNLLDESHKNCPKQGRCVTCAMRQLLLSYHSSSGGVGSQLGALDNAIRATGKTSDPRWSAVGHTQEDSNDFLQYLLGTIEKAKGVQKDQFSSLFGVKHKISWSCDGCKKTHVHSDPPNFSLSLPIPKQSGTVNITDCLNTYHRESNVTIRCDKCKKNSKRTRVFQLDNAPDVLPIQLMRFGFGARGPTKNKQHVEYPEELDLTRWSLDTSKPLRYRLQAIVAHSGTLKFGHYIAYVRGADGIKEISDDTIMNSSPREWKRPTTNFNPYILVYIKQ
ncbi:cysteine proteinase [Aureobasidium pullulans]|nr:cysteine proteinase [Aureobasidium pullulans]